MKHSVLGEKRREERRRKRGRERGGEREGERDRFMVLTFAVQHTWRRNACDITRQREEEMAEISLHCEKQSLYTVQGCKGT